MKLAEIKELMEHFDHSGLGSLEIKNEDFSVKMEKPFCPPPHFHPPGGPHMPMPIANHPVGAVAPTAPPQSPVEEQWTAVKAPLVGVFYQSPAPDKAPFVTEGKQVNAGEVVCLMEAMKMMTEIKAPVSGIVRRILVNNEDVLGVGDVIMQIEE